MEENIEEERMRRRRFWRTIMRSAFKVIVDFVNTLRGGTWPTGVK